MRNRPIKPFKGAKWNGVRWEGNLPRKKFYSKSKIALQRTAIRRISKKGRIKSLIYAERRRDFLNQPENQICPVMLVLYDEKRRTAQIHHRKGRVGKNFLDESTWLAVSFEGHSEIHKSPERAYKMGWMEKR